MLGGGEAPRAHLFRVRLDAAQHLRLDGGEALGELGLEVVVDGQQVVEDEDLPVRARARRRSRSRGCSMCGMIVVGDLGGDRLEDDGEAAGLLQRERVVEHLAGARRRAALGAVAAEHRGRLRREADVAHHGDAGADDRAGPLGGGAAALELDRVAAGLLDEALRGVHRQRVGGLVGAERQVADQQRRLQAAADGAGEHQQLLDA